MKENNKLWSKNFVLIIIINFLVFLNHLMVLSAFPLFITNSKAFAEIGSDTIAGACATVFSLIGVVCRPFVGIMLDSGKRRSILIVGLILMALMPMGYLFAFVLFVSIALAIVCRMAHGVALALSNTTTSTIATDVIPKTRFGEGMGMFGMATALATAIAPSIGQLLMKKASQVGGKTIYDFKYLFIVATVIMVLSLVLFSFLKMPKINVEKKPFSFKNLIDRDALPASLTTLIFLITYGSLENFTIKFAMESDDISISGGVYFALMAVMLFLTRISIGKISDKRGESIFVYSCNGSMFVALMLIAFVPCNVSFIISALLSGYAFGGLEPALQAMAVSIAPPNKRGAANSTFLCAYDIGIGVGGGLAGWLIDAVGYNHMFAIIAAANVLSAIVYVLIGRHHPSSITFRLENERKGK